MTPDPFSPPNPPVIASAAKQSPMSTDPLPADPSPSSRHPERSEGSSSPASATNPDLAQSPPTRRDFLKLATRGLLYLSGLLGLGGLLRYLSYEPDPPPPARFEVGLADDYQPGSRTLLAAIPAVLVRKSLQEGDGFSALSLVCSHLGCTVEIKPEDYLCPCHGSRYALDGSVLKGPATSPLPPLRVELTKDNHLIVYKEQ